MRLWIFILMATQLLAMAQTNDDFRTLKFQGRSRICNVNTDPRWVVVTIPKGAAFMNLKDVHMKQEGDQQGITFVYPAIYNNTRPAYIRVDNLPYSPEMFEDGPVQQGTGINQSQFKVGTYNIVNGLVTKRQLTFRAYQLFPPTTNFDAFGRMKITPAKPVFDYGVKTNL